MKWIHLDIVGHETDLNRAELTRFLKFGCKYA